MSIATKTLHAVKILARAQRITKAEFLSVSGYPPAQADFYFKQFMDCTTVEKLAQSEKVWISGDMVDVALHAAKSLPDYKWTPSVLPWENAVCVAEKPLFRGHHVIQWSTGDLQGYCDVIAWMIDKRQEPAMPFPVASANLPREGSFAAAKLYGVDEHVTAFGKLVPTLWLLLQQKVAVRRIVYADRVTRRRAMERGEVEPPTITVIELRKPIHVQSGERGSTPVDWSHRWMVNHHWRYQYHPSTGQNSWVYIAEHVKGPDDKPLVLKDRVFAWVR